MSRKQRGITILSAVSLAVLAGCPAQSTVGGASYAPSTTMKLAASSRCASGNCACRPLDSDAGQTEEGILPGLKRFELRVPRSTSAIWIEVGDRGVFYKEPEKVKPACFYVDLPVGEHKITIHSEKRDPEIGLQTGLTVHEYGAKMSNWYRSLHFICGGEDRCTKTGLKNWAGFQRRQPRGVLDPCGSVMVRGVSFGGRHGGRGADEYEEVTVRMTLKIYAFEPYRPAKSNACTGPIKNR